MSERDVDAWLDAAAPVASALQTETADPVLVTEADHAKKLTVQRGVTVGWFVPQTSPGESTLALPPNFLSALDSVLEDYADGYRRVTTGGVPVLAPDPAQTNSGFPFFFAHPFAKLASAAFRSSRDATIDPMLELGAQWCGRMGLPASYSFANGLGGRSGPAYKWLTRWDRAGSDFVGAVEWRGHSQRNRVVQMTGFGANRACRRLFGLLHVARSQLPGLYRAGNVDTWYQSGPPWAKSFEADISGFDATVTLQVQAALASAIAARWPSYAASAADWFRLEQRGLIGPSFRGVAAECSLQRKVGGTSSGLKLTSVVGTLIARAGTVMALLDQGLTVQEIRRMQNADSHAGGDFCHCSHQGDDIKILTTLDLDPTRFTASFEAIGLKCELRPGYSFLAKHILPSGASIPLAARLIQQTMSNEHEPVAALGSEGLLFLGLLARLEGAAAVQPDLAAWANRVIRHSAFLRSAPAGTLAELHEWLASDRDVATAIDRAVAKAASRPWLAQLLRDADHSPAGRFVSEWLRAARPSFLDTLTSLDHSLDRAASWVESQPLSTRLDVIARATDAMFSSSPKQRLDALWLATLSRLGLPTNPEP